MSAQAYVNGRYLPIHAATLSVEDRGLQFGDSIYEVVAVFAGRLFDWQPHLKRLRAGADALQFPALPGDAALAEVAAQLLRRARLGDGLLYIQISRGTARRDHPFPDAAPNIVMTARRFDFTPRSGQQRQGVAAISGPNERWAHCDLKTTNLLPAVLAKQQARQAGAFEAIFIGGDGNVREGASTNVHMVDKAGAIITHPKGPEILPGIMRDTMLTLARVAGIAVVERPFSREEALAAPELFLTSTTAPVLPIVRLDGAAIGSGTPGPLTTRLAGLMWGEIRRQTGWSHPG